MGMIPDMDKRLEDRIEARRFALKARIAELSAKDSAEARDEIAGIEHELSELARTIELADQGSDEARSRLGELLN